MRSQSRQWATVGGLSMKTLSLTALTCQFSVFILLLHYSRVMPTPDGHRYLPSTAVFLVELLRLSICLTISLYEISLSVPRSMPVTALLGALANAIFGGDSWKMAMPAGLYTLANSLQYVGISNLDAATFHVTYQLKIIVTAVLSVVMLKRVINGRQWLSLVLLMVGVAVVSMPDEDAQSLAPSHHARVHVPRASNPFRDYFSVPERSSLGKRSATYEGIAEDELALSQPMMDASLGLTAVFGICMFSGWAGVYFEKVIKESPKTTSLWIRNVQLSIYSLFPAFFIGVLFLDGETVAKNGFFAGYNWIVAISILVQAFGAIVGAFVMFYADNISKNFAISISMVLSSLGSVLFFGFNATTNFVVGTLMVMAATWLYNLHDTSRSQAAAPSIRIDRESEKPPLVSPTEANDASIQIPKTPLAIAEEALSTSRPGSPSHKKRKSDHLGYFTKMHE